MERNWERLQKSMREALGRFIGKANKNKKKNLRAQSFDLQTGSSAQEICISETALAQLILNLQK